MTLQLPAGSDPSRERSVGRGGHHGVGRIAGALAAARGAGASAWLSPARLLIAAAIFHLTLIAACYGLGRLHLLPGTFDADGIAFSFARDSGFYREEAA